MHKNDTLEEAVQELLNAVDKFTPDDATMDAYNALQRDDGGPRVYGHTCNMKGGDGGYIPYTDHDMIRLRMAVDRVKGLLNV
jgi:hypothetical protein